MAKLAAFSLLLSCLLGSLVAGQTIKKAVAVVSDNTDPAKGVVKGTVVFEEVADGVQVSARISGLYIHSTRSHLCIDLCSVH